MTRAEIQFVHSLQTKKYRDKHRLFIAEGKKLVFTLQQHLKVHNIYVTQPTSCDSAKIISEMEMKRISSFSTPSSVLGIFEQPQHNDNIDFASQWTLALDDVQDPSNVGAIIRLCDWFGIGALLCSTHTADCYAPKAIQATMGAIARINALYVNLPEFLPLCKAPIYGTFLTGNNIYEEKITSKGIIVLGSEGRGISPQVNALIVNKLHIPSFAAGKVSESLNVAATAAIVCSEIRRHDCTIKTI